MKQVFAAIWPCLFICAANAQDSSIGKKWQVSGFADLYYQYDFNQPLSNERPSFIYNHKKHNRPSLNLAVLKLSYNSKKLTGNLALMAGDYSRYNLAAEPRLLQHVYAANVGYMFTDKLSVEAGILPSHIGMESAISKDCWNLSRSLLAENSPYYETGMKVNYVFSEKLTTAVYIIQGWQNIKDNNRWKAVGTQLVFKPGSKWLLNSSSFIGNELPDSVRTVARIFHNLYVNGMLTQNISIAFLLDAGLQGKQGWWGTAAMLQYQLHKHLLTAVRAEYYNDKKGVIVSLYQTKPFAAGGFSLNIDYLGLKFVSLRSELKYMLSPHTVFAAAEVPQKNNLSLLTSVAIGF